MFFTKKYSEKELIALGKERKEALKRRVKETQEKEKSCVHKYELLNSFGYDDTFMCEKCYKTMSIISK